MTQPRIYLSSPHLGGREGALLQDVLDSNWVAPVGPQLAEFERKVARRMGVDHAVAVSSGTAAIHLALRCIGVQPGDEVLCSSFTFCASANPIVYQHARPVFIDADRATWNMDPQLLADELANLARLRRLPRAVIAVDILGQSIDADRILEITDRYEIPLIQDCAESLGSSYRGRAAGADARASIVSFNGNKIITTGGGGMLCSSDGQLIDEARFLSTQAKDPGTIYQHSTIGFNYRLSNLLAAVGIGQLECLDDFVASRRRIRDFYREQLGDLPGLEWMPEAEYGTSNCWLTTVLVDPARFGCDNETLRQALEAENIESRRVWKPLHRQPVFAGCRCRGGQVADDLFARGLCLPSGSAMTESDLRRVVSAVRGTAASRTIRRAA